MLLITYSSGNGTKQAVSIVELAAQYNSMQCGDVLPTAMHCGVYLHVSVWLVSQSLVLLFVCGASVQVYMTCTL